jgi:hypothetical protein
LIYESSAVRGQDANDRGRNQKLGKLKLSKYGKVGAVKRSIDLAA